MLNTELVGASLRTPHSTEPVTCIDFGGSAIRVCIEHNGEFTLPQSEEVIPGRELDLALVLVERIHQQSGRAPSALSVAVPGIVDFRTSTMLKAHEKYASLDGIDLKQWFQRHWDVPFFLDNDARVALIGETSVGVAAGTSNAVLVILGTGIGTAALVDGVVVRGHSGHGGILGGHITADFDGDRCPCGNRGCAELLASTWALTSHSVDQAPAGVDNLKKLVDTVRTNDAHATLVLERFIRVWGSTIVSLCHLFDPEVVIVTGSPMKSSDQILPQLTEFVGSHLWSSMTTPRIAVPENPDFSVFRGLASLARTKVRQDLI
jgi:glucokinase